jgi:hypothetical protein
MKETTSWPDLARHTGELHHGRRHDFTPDFCETLTLLGAGRDYATAGNQAATLLALKPRGRMLSRRNFCVAWSLA